MTKKSKNTFESRLAVANATIKQQMDANYTLDKENDGLRAKLSKLHKDQEAAEWLLHKHMTQFFGD